MQYIHYPRIIIFFLAISFSTGAFPQAPDEKDSLAKYSYLLYGIKPADRDAGTAANVHMGTCFFVRQQSRLFLISAYHLFTCVDVYSSSFNPLKHLYDPDWDSLRIRFTDTVNHEPVYYTIDLDSIKRESPIVFAPDYPDVYIYPVDTATLPKNISVNSIENLLFAKNTNDTVSDKTAFFYGFPQPKLDARDTRMIYQVNPDTTRITYNEFNRIEQQDDLPAIDILKDLNRKYQIATPLTYGGASGAPVFAKCRQMINNETIEWISFVGLQSGRDLINNLSFIVRKQEVIEKLQEKINVLNKNSNTASHSIYPIQQSSFIFLSAQPN